MVILDNTTLTEFSNLHPPWQYLSVNFSHYWLHVKKSFPCYVKAGWAKIFGCKFKTFSRLAQNLNNNLFSQTRGYQINDRSMHNWRFISQATRVRHFERSATLLPSSPTLRKIPRSPHLAHNLLLCRLRRSKHKKELRISHDDRLLQFWEKKQKLHTIYLLPRIYLILFSRLFQVWKTSSPVSRRFQEFKVAFDWKIWMYILKSELWICNRTQKRISLPRNPSWKWISIMKSKSACLGNPKKRICKTVSWTVVYFLL